MAILPSQDVWVVANFKETQMKNVHPGQKVVIEADTLPGRRFTGHVESLAAGTGATFALLPPDNATGNFTKVVQRVPVKILFDPGQKDRDRLRAGLSVVATIETR
jgi:membrane fusion protein, multidrug efflux system